MSFEIILFYIFSFLAILSAIMVISSNNPVHSVLFLILVFLNGTGLFITLEVEFIAMVLLMVYVGAVAVLFLFVVMMLNVRISELRDSILKYIPIGSLIGIIFFFQLLIILENSNYTESENISGYVNWVKEITRVTNIQAIGEILYTKYFILFMLAGLLLLVAMIGAIVLTMYRRSLVKRQDIFTQLSRNFKTVVYSKN